MAQASCDDEQHNTGGGILIQENEDAFHEWLLEKGEEHGISRDDAEKAVMKVAPHTLFDGTQREEYDDMLAELEACIDLLIDNGMPSANLNRIRDKLPKIVADRMMTEQTNGE